MTARSCMVMIGRVYFALGMGIIKITNTAFTMLHNAFRSLDPIQVCLLGVEFKCLTCICA